jgi:hypothetical protein
LFISDAHALEKVSIPEILNVRKGRGGRKGKGERKIENKGRKRKGEKEVKGDRREKEKRRNRRKAEGTTAVDFFGKKLKLRKLRKLRTHFSIPAC